MVSIIAALRGILLLISLISGVWSALNGLNLKNNVDVYNNQVMLARAGEGDVTALPPGVLDYAATVLPGILSVVSLFARSYLGKDSVWVNVIDQAGKLIPTPKPVGPGGLVAPVSDVTNAAETIRALALLSGPLAGLLSPLASAIQLRLEEQGLPVGVNLELIWSDGTNTVLYCGPSVPRELETPEEITHQPVVANTKPSNN